MTLEVDAEYETYGGETKDDEVDIVGRYDYLLENDNFIYGRLEGERDTTDDLNIRGTVAGGYGHYWLKTDDLILETRLGLQFRYTDYKGQPSASQEALDTVVGLIYDINEFTSFKMDINFAPRLSEPQFTYLNMKPLLSLNWGMAQIGTCSWVKKKELSTEEEREAEDYDLEAFVRLVYEFN